MPMHAYRSGDHLTRVGKLGIVSIPPNGLTRYDSLIYRLMCGAGVNVKIW